MNFAYKVEQEKVGKNKFQALPEIHFEKGNIYSNEGIQAEENYKLTEEMIIKLNDSKTGTKL